MKSDIEIWKIIPGFSKYQVSSLGRVRNNKGIMKPHNDRGYMRIMLIPDIGNRRGVRVHQLVAMAFLNHKLQGMKLTIDHIDGDKMNNTVNNLEIVSNRENCTRSKDKSKTSSKYTGVCFHKQSGKWLASIKTTISKGNYKQISLGLYSDEYEAHIAYTKKLKEMNDC